MKKTALIYLLLWMASTLWAQTPKLVVPLGHSSPIAHIAVSPDNRYTLTADENNIIKLWLTESGHCLFTLESNGLQAAGFSPESDKLVLLAKDGSLKISDLFTLTTIYETNPYYSKLDTTIIKKEIRPDTLSNAAWYPFVDTVITENGVWLVEPGVLDINGKVIQEEKLIPPPMDTTYWLSDTLVRTNSLLDPSRQIKDAVLLRGAEELLIVRNDFVQLIDIKTDRLKSSWLPEGKVSFDPLGSSVLVITEKIAVRDALSGALRFLIPPVEGEDQYTIETLYSADGLFVGIKYSSQQLQVWDLKTEKLHYSIDLGDQEVEAIAPKTGMPLLESPGDLVEIQYSDVVTYQDFGSGNLELFNHQTNARHASFTGHIGGVMKAVFSQDGQFLVSGGRDTQSKVWDTRSGRRLHDLPLVQFHTPTDARFLKGSPKLITQTEGRSTYLWDLRSGRIQKQLPISGRLLGMTTSANRIFTYQDTSLYSWNTHSGRVELQYPFPQLKNFHLSPDESFILINNYEGRVSKLGLTPEQRPIRSRDFPGLQEMTFSSKSGRWYLNLGDSIQVFSPTFEQQIRSIPNQSGREEDGLERSLLRIGSDFLLMDDDHQLLTRFFYLFHPYEGKSGSFFNIWGLREQKLMMEYAKLASPIDQPKLIPGSRNFTGIFKYSYDLPVIDPLHPDEEHLFIRRFKGHLNEIFSVTPSPNGQFLISSSKDKTVKIWEHDSVPDPSAADDAVATLVHGDSMKWVVTAPSGLFDAAPTAFRDLYYVVNFAKRWEVIELEQLKARYYEPGLLSKLLGYSEERLRPVEDFDAIRLYPRTVARIIQDTLFIDLHERNGGIGKVSIFINGKEVAEEANPLPRRENAKRDSTIQYDLGEHQNYFFRHPDSVNIISIRAYNEEGWLKSPATELEYQIPAGRSRGSGSSENGSAWVGRLDPKLYVIAIGTSDYTGTKLDLQYADQDATMMARALQSVGTALFTNGDSLEVYCLSTAGADATGLEGTPIHWQFADKNNIESVFRSIRLRAKAEDVIVVYLSGHGVTYGSAEQARFHYLTQGIAGEDLSDAAIRQAYTISSEELTDWINNIPALKQVLIIDACNSGQIVENLSSGTKALNSSQIRALDRMKDRTGMFVLSGSAADKVSYEAGEYGQGLLTYALLQGMLGIATRKDNEGKETIDVMKLFQYARDRVPELAGSINGIQTPMLGFPNRAASFDIGLLDEQARKAIPIGSKKPVVVKSFFLDQNTFQDDLRLAERLETAFRKETEKGADADLIYVDVYDYPGAYSLSGLYETSPEGIKIKVKLFKDRKDPVELELRPTDDPERLVRYMVREVKRSVE